MFDVNFLEKALKIKTSKIGFPLTKEFLGFSIDSRTVQKDQCFIAIKGERFDGHNFIKECFDKGVRFFIAEKAYGKKVKQILREGFVFLVKNTNAALADLAHSYKNTIFSSIIAITGSSGKTTTRELMVRMLSKKYPAHTAQKNFNNEIGLPLTILSAPFDTRVIVLEMGMNHSGEIKKLSLMVNPLVGLITNIGYAHIGNLGSLEAIAQAKAELFFGMDSHCFSFLNRDDSYFQYLKMLAPCEILDFGGSDLKVVQDKGIKGYRLSYQGMEFDFSLAGEHNLANLAAALKVAEFYKVSVGDRVDAAASFQPIPGRFHVIEGDMVIIDDCYNANPSSVIAGLSLLKKAEGRKIAILADMLELGHLSEELHILVGHYIAQNRCADLVLTTGHCAKAIADEALKGGTKAFWFETREELIRKAVELTQKGDTILVKASHGMRLEEVVSALSKAKAGQI
jgi:UDP-N-acetylmuramoyl-tripeptide--D-alanyl-D-alanine ligase